MQAARAVQRSFGEIALIFAAFLFAAALLVVPLALIFSFALREGLGVYLANIAEPTPRWWSCRSISSSASASPGW